jgi:hypothetical protein
MIYRIKQLIINLFKKGEPDEHQTHLGIGS